MIPFEDERIGLRHGSGGRSMRGLIAAVCAAGFPPGADGDVGLAALDDGAALRVGERWLVLSTDAHVVAPLRFPGGDIGRLAVCGTVNDLAMMGATEPLGIASAFVIEAGFATAELRAVVASMSAACAEAGTTVVTGDTKVMGNGEIDGLAIVTTGAAFADRVVRSGALRPGDRVIVSGAIAEHGFAVMAARHGIDAAETLRSDVAPLNGLVRDVLRAAGDAVVALKDPTRGGIAAALHELAAASGVGMLLDEAAIPLGDAARAVSELLGIDPLCVANEGKALVGVRPEACDRVVAALRAHPLGRAAAVIGTVTAARPGTIVADTGFGRRLVAEPDGELLPRIC